MPRYHLGDNNNRGDKVARRPNQGSIFATQSSCLREMSLKICPHVEE
jgi:hypothetical protein